MTVMFCDLIGSTSLSEELDPEDFRDLITLYQRTCDEAVKRYEGTIAKFLGDGILVYFGYPKAHEDDPVRAVRAGLEVIERLPEMNARLRERSGSGQIKSVGVRIGIHTGLVVVGDMSTESFSEKDAIVGQTPNIAARLQDVAQPNTIVLSSDTNRLVFHAFDCVSLGARQLKGVSQPVEVHQVMEDRGLLSREEMSLGRTVTPLIGRERETNLIVSRWKLAAAGRGQVVTLSGEAGIGKTRLLYVLRDRLQGETYLRLRCQGSAYFRDSAFYPVRELLQRILQFERDEGHEARARKLEALTRRYGMKSETPLLARLLSIKLGPDYESQELSPELQKKETMKALIELLLAMAGEQPLLMLVEDLHWIDHSTLELVELLAERIAEAPVMLVLTFRPDFEAPWPGLPQATAIELKRLTTDQVNKLVERITGGRKLPEPIVRQIVTKTDGVPLFVEELTKMVMESDMLIERDGRYVIEGSLPKLEIPATLQDSLMARLDRLNVDRRVTQIAAALGREFSHQLIAAVSPIDEERLRGELDRLVEAEVFFRRGRPPNAEYLFKHALIQETAYRSLLKSTRQKFHLQIARVLKDRFPEIARTQPEVMARHYTEAGDYLEAIPCWEKAGQRALRQSGHVEAVSHFQRGIDLVRALEDGPERVRMELVLQASLGNALMSTRGYGATEVERAYTRAWQLSQQVGQAPMLLNTQFGLWGFYLLRGELETASQLARDCLAGAEMIKLPYALEQAYFSMGKIHFWTGELAPAEEFFEKGIQLFDENYRRTRSLPAVQDPAVGSRAVLGMTLWLQGRRLQGMELLEESLSLADQLKHPFSRSFALSFAALTTQLDGDVDRTHDLARQSVALCAEQGFSFYLALCMILEGWTLFMEGARDRAIRRMEEGVEAYRESGNLGRPYLEALLAGAYWKTGRHKAAIDLMENVERDTYICGGRYYLAEIFRMQAEFAMTGEAETPWQPEERLRKAIEIAGAQGAHMLRLRSAAQLADLLSESAPDDPRSELQEAVALLDPKQMKGYPEFEAAQNRLAELDRLPDVQTKG